MNQENIFDGGYSFMSTPCSISYLFTNKSVRTYALHIFSLSIYPMKLHEFFFFLQALAGFFFSSSIPCMNFFFGSDTPPPRISNGPPLRTFLKKIDSNLEKYKFARRFEGLRLDQIS